jgi:hypothetical protein
VGRRTALIAATYEYDDPELPELTAPRHDAETSLSFFVVPSSEASM